jgi:hypothetical protein
MRSLSQHQQYWILVEHCHQQHWILVEHCHQQYWILVEHCHQQYWIFVGHCSQKHWILVGHFRSVKESLHGVDLLLMHTCISSRMLLPI